MGTGVHFDATHEIGFRGTSIGSNEPSYTYDPPSWLETNRQEFDPTETNAGHLERQGRGENEKPSRHFCCSPSRRDQAATGPLAQFHTRCGSMDSSRPAQVHDAEPGRSTLTSMPEDLYQDDLRSIPGPKLYEAIRAFTLTDRPLDERPREGYFLDFKEDLTEDSKKRFLHSAAGFANTFGGLLLLGVSEKDGRPENLVGLVAQGELTTQVASLLASNLFPCPPLNIGECQLPTDPARKLCAVRIRETAEICLIARKGEDHPVYVRIADQSRPADASQLRALLERKRQVQSASSWLAGRVDRIRQQLFVTRANTGGPNAQRVRSETFFRLVLCPFAHASMPLDSAIERRFATLISDKNPGLQFLVDQRVATGEFHRSRDWFELRFIDGENDYERRWHLGVNGEIGFVTQTKWPVAQSTPLWSLYDLAADVSSILSIAKDFWKSTGYYGAFRLEAELNVSGLTLHTGSSGFPRLFYDRLGAGMDFPLDRTAIAITQSPKNVGDAEADLDYVSLESASNESVALIINQLLRCLGHLADLTKLRQTLGF